jgi:AcrR family transcriptional regulator
MLAFAVELCVRYTQDLFSQYLPTMKELPIHQALSVYLKEGIEWSKTEQGLLQLFARAAYQGDAALIDRLVKPIATTLREMVRELLASALERGELRRDLDLEAVSRIVHALTIVVGDSQLLPYLNNYFQVVDPSLELDRIYQAFLDLVFHGIEAPRMG